MRTDRKLKERILEQECHLLPAKSNINVSKEVICLPSKDMGNETDVKEGDGINNNIVHNLIRKFEFKGIKTVEN